MTVIDTEVRILASADDAYYRATGGYTNSGTNHPLGDHTNASYKPFWGLRFKIPSTVDPDTISAVVLKLNAVTSGTMGATFIRVEQNGDGAVWDSSTRRPDTVWTNIGATYETSWSGSATADTYSVSPDFSADVITAMATWDYDNDYLHVTLGPKSTTTATINHYTFDNTGTAADPILVITHDVPPANNSVTTVAPAVAAQPSLGTAIGHLEDQVYHDSIGSDVRRVLDIHWPTGGVGAMPADGWPLVVWVHGGSWVAGDENDDALAQRSATVRRGYAYASVRYKWSDVDVNTYSHPHQAQDVICALKWLAARSDIDGSQIVLTGYSAGGHIALEAALAVHDGTSYTWADDGPAGDDRGGDSVDTPPDWRFTQGRDTSGVTIKGVYLWDSPHDIVDLWAYNALQANNIKALSGYKWTDTMYPSTFSNELVVSALIDGMTTGAGRSNTTNIYDGNPHIPRFPICYVIGYEWNGGAGDGANVVLRPASGITDIIRGLDNVGYPTVADLATGSTLDVDYANLSIHTANKSASSGTTWMNTYGDAIHNDIYPYWDFEGKYGPWLDALDGWPYADAVAVTVTVPTPAVEAGTASNNGVTTTAPVAAAAITDPAVAVADVVEVTTTAPAAAAAVTGPGLEVSSEATTTAPVVAVAITDPAAAVSDVVEVTTTAPGVAAAITDPAVAVADAVEVTPSAPLVAATIADPGVEVYAAGEVLTVAPGAAAAITDPAVAVADAVEVTPSAPLVAAAITDPAVMVAADVTTTAPAATATVPDVVIDTSVQGEVTPSAPLAAVAITDPAVSVSAGITTTAPATAMAITTPGAAVAEAVGVTTIAPSVAFDVTVDPSFEAAVYVTPAAAVVAFQVGVWQQLIALRTRRTRRRPDFAHATRRSST